MEESSTSSCSAESDVDSFLSGSVNYSTECSDDCSISDLSVSAVSRCYRIVLSLRRLIASPQVMAAK